MADETSKPATPFRHRIQLTLDETTGEVTCRHYTDVSFGRRDPRLSSTNRDVELTKAFKKQVKDLLSIVLDANRESMEDQSDQDAAQLHHLTSAGKGQAKLTKVSLTSSTKPE